MEICLEFLGGADNSVGELTSKVSVICADTSFVLLDVTCSPHGLVVHKQIFAT